MQEIDLKKLHEEDSYDPFEDNSDPLEQEGEFIPPEVDMPENLDAKEDSQEKIEQDKRPAEERLEELFGKMKTKRSLLLKVLKFCLEERASEEVDKIIEDHYVYDVAIYSPSSIRALLEDAGGLEKIEQKSENEKTDENKIEEIDLDEPVEELDKNVVQVEFDEVSTPPEFNWKTTNAGKKILESDDPINRFHKFLNEEEKCGPLYYLVLEKCKAPCTKKQLDEVVDSHELAKDPRRYSQYFTERLERCEMVEWRNGWQITELGQQVLDEREK